MSDTTKRTYLALGDSYTCGEAVEPSQSFPAQLVASLRTRGVHIDDPQIIATTGWTTGELMYAVAHEDVTQTYDLVTLLIGVNNQYRGPQKGFTTIGYRAEFAELLQTALRLAGNDPGRVVVVSIPDYGVTPSIDAKNRTSVAAEIDTYNQINRQESMLRGVHYVDITPISRQALGDHSLTASDGLHPSGNMYGLWLKELLPVAASLLNATTSSPPVKHSQTTDIATMTNVLSVMSGAMMTQVVSAGVASGLPDHLTDQPQKAAKLARIMGITLPNFMRLVRSWAAFGLLAIDDDGNLLQTSLTLLLKKDSQGPFYYRALELGHPELFRVFESLGIAILDGSDAFQRTHKQTMYSFFADRPELAEIFDKDLSGNSRGIGDSLAGFYDFSKASSIVDIGGGNGTTLTRLLRTWPQLNGSIFERAETKPAAQALLKAEGLANRCEVVTGDFFKAIPENQDIYLLKYVLQDWSDKEAIALLKTCRRAMSDSSRLLILEQIIPDQPTATPQSQSAVLDDLLVFAFTGGGNRTMSQLVAVIQAAGLTICEPSSRLPQVNVIECRVANKK